MNARGKAFTAEEVRAIRDGSMTDFLEAVRPQPRRTINDWTRDAEVGESVFYRDWPCRLVASRGRNKRAAGQLTPQKIRCPYAVGQGIWVKEPWHTDTLPLSQARAEREDLMCTLDPIYFRADHPEDAGWRWRSAARMPRWASRTTLEVVARSVEQRPDGYFWRVEFKVREARK